MATVASSVSSLKEEIMAKFNVTVRPNKYKDRPHQKWVINIYHPVEGRSRKFAPTEEQAKTIASAEWSNFEQYGLQAMKLTAEQRIVAIDAFKRIAPFGVTLTDVVRDFVDRKSASTATMLELTALYLKSREALGRSKPHLSGLRTVLGSFNEEHGFIRASDITSAQIDDWLSTQDVEPRTVNHRRAMLHAVFQFGVMRKIVRENAVKQVEKRKVKKGKVGIHTPDQMRRLLEVSVAQRDPGLVATFAIGGFAGLRPEEVARLNWDAIDLDHGQIDCHEEITKIGMQRYVKIQPVLAEWLRVAMCIFTSSNEGAKMNILIQGTNFRRRFDLARRLAGFAVNAEMFRLKPDARGQETAAKQELDAAWADLVPWPHDAFRHSYASYHLAEWPDAAALAMQMGHQTTKMIFSNYRARVKKSDAVLWWGLLPKVGAA
jgi:integrase